MAIAKLGSEVYNLLRLGFLKAESAGSDRAIKAATTKYNKALSNNPEFARVESIRLNGDTQRNVQNLGERTVINPESLLGDVIVPVAGDRTLTGNTLTKSQGFGLLNNVKVKGGPKFMMEHQDKGLGWASMKGAARQKQKNFDLAARETDNPNIVGVYTAMGDEANNFATPIADTIIGQLSGNKIPKEVISEFDDIIRKANPGWVGVNHPKARSQLMGLDGYPQKGAGALRSRFTKLASMAKYRDQGFPSRNRIRDDVVEPELLNADRGASGFTMFDAVPNGETISFTENPSYDTGILGQFRGGLTESVPAEIMFPDVFSQLSKKVNKAGNTLSRGEILGSLVMDPKLYQKADQKWLDNIAGYLEKNQGKLGASLPAMAVGLLSASASDDSEAGVLGKATSLMADMASEYAKVKPKTHLEGILAQGEQANLSDDALSQGYKPDVFHHVGSPDMDAYDINANRVSGGSTPAGLYTHNRMRDSKLYEDIATENGRPWERYSVVSSTDKPFVVGETKPNDALKDNFIKQMELKFGDKYSDLPDHKKGYWDEKIDKFMQYGNTTASPLTPVQQRQVYLDSGYDSLLLNGNEMVFLDTGKVRDLRADFNKADVGQEGLFKSSPAALAGAGILGLGAAAQSNDTYADYSPSNLAKLRNDDE